jgi:hypothetical protein
MARLKPPDHLIPRFEYPSFIWESIMQSHMQAAVAEQFGQPLVIQQLPIPVPGAGQILVKTEACGVCHTDLHAAHGDWAIKPDIAMAVAGISLIWFELIKNLRVHYLVESQQGMQEGYSGSKPA